MGHRRRHSLFRLGPALVLAVVSIALAGCGVGSGDATGLLHQTFTGTHRIHSGNLGFTLTVVPTGSTTLKGPISLSLSGPFQTLGPGKLPQSAFRISLAAQGARTAVTIISTGTSGYVTFQGQSYKLPQATYQRLESGFSQLGSSPGAGNGSGVLGRLGIKPQRWLVHPRIVGEEAVGGVETTHIRAGINVAALLADLNTFLQRASSLGVSGASSLPHGISQATRTRIAGEIRNPTFDLWTGKGDKTLRRLQIRLTLPVTGRTSTLLGGLRSADVELTMQYADLNQPQTVAAPTALVPYSVFQTKLRALLQGLQTGISGAATGGLPGTSGAGSTTGSGSASGSSSAGGSGPNYQSYTQCIQAAGSDIAKMQKCAPLLNAK
jgi:hypothetical protein